MEMLICITADLIRRLFLIPSKVWKREGVSLTGWGGDSQSHPRDGVFFSGFWTAETTNLHCLHALAWERSNREK